MERFCTAFLTAGLFLISAACLREEAVTVNPDPTPTETPFLYRDLRTGEPIPNEYEKVDKQQREETVLNNRAFEEVPSEFKGVDFANLRYFFGRLKDGEFVDEDSHPGGTTYTLGAVYFTDLTGDDVKEATVFIHAVSCGGSCDGGSFIVFFFSVRNNRPRLIDHIEFGSRSDGCSLKSFVIRNRAIEVEQFGHCKDDSKWEEGREYSCKFCVKGLTRSVYSLSNNRLERNEVEVTETAETNVMNYSSEIRIQN